MTQAEEAFTSELAPSAIRTLQRLPEKVAAAAIEFICATLAQNPHRAGIRCVSSWKASTAPAAGTIASSTGSTSRPMW